MKNNKKHIPERWETTVVRSIEEVEGIRSIWEEMQRRESHLVINADIDRYLSVIKASSDNVQPHVMLFRQDSHPIAMVIGRFERHSVKLQLRYKTLFRPALKCLTVVYGGIFGQPTDELYAAVIHKGMEELRRSEVDVVYSNHLRTDSHLYSLVRRTPSLWCRGYFPDTEKHWIMSTPENIECFYKARSKKHRGNLKRAIRKLEKECANRVWNIF